MITTALIYMAGFAVDAILIFFYPFKDSNGFPTGVDTAINNAAVYMGYADSFISLQAVQITVTFIIAVELVLFWFRIMRWLFGFIPFVNDNGAGFGSADGWRTVTIKNNVK